MSVYALLTGAVLLLLVAPLVWIASRVARDHPWVGIAFVVGMIFSLLSLELHLGSRLVDITFGTIVVSALALVAATVLGFARRSRPVVASLPTARVRR